MVGYEPVVVANFGRRTCFKEWLSASLRTRVLGLRLRLPQVRSSGSRECTWRRWGGIKEKTRDDETKVDKNEESRSENKQHKIKRVFPGYLEERIFLVKIETGQHLDIETDLGLSGEYRGRWVFLVRPSSGP